MYTILYVSKHPCTELRRQPCTTGDRTPFFFLFYRLLHRAISDDIQHEKSLERINTATTIENWKILNTETNNNNAELAWERKWIINICINYIVINEHHIEVQQLPLISVLAEWSSLAGQNALVDGSSNAGSSAPWGRQQDARKLQRNAGKIGRWTAPRKWRRTAPWRRRNSRKSQWIRHANHIAYAIPKKLMNPENGSCRKLTKDIPKDILHKDLLQVNVLRRKRNWKHVVRLHQRTKENLLQRVHGQIIGKQHNEKHTKKNRSK